MSATTCILRHSTAAAQEWNINARQILTEYNHTLQGYTFVEFQGQKSSRYLLKPRNLVYFYSSVQDEGRAKAKDVSKKWVELHQNKNKH